MVEWSIDAFRAVGSTASIVVAVPPGSAHGIAAADDVQVVDGGAARVDSVANALAVVETELVAIHDAARPLLTPELVEDLVARLESSPEAAGVIAAAPVTDTIKRVGPGSRPALTPRKGTNAGLVVGETLDRSQLWAAQTPQVFRTAALREALGVVAEQGAAATDEAMLVEGAGGTVLIHPAGVENLKVTTPLDLRLAELLLAERASA
jgi:2-C-methyl-D-erythritol 4-phosphate cytidylyltransferase